MQFNPQRKKQRTRPIKIEGLGGLDQYQHSLQFYTHPPQDSIALQEFEDYAIERLKVLKAVETVGIRHVKGTDEYSEALEKEMRKLAVLRAALKRNSKEPTKEEYEERRKDHISHFILRLAYCRSEELRRWFMQQEMDLFRFRFNRENKESIEKFLMMNNLSYSPIPDKEKNEVLMELVQSSYNLSAYQAENTDFFKVPFMEALDLVKNRKVYLRDGYAYVPHGELVVIILSVFRSSLSHALAVTSRALPHLEEDERLLPMLCGLSKRYLGQDYSNKKPSGSHITADMIDMLSRKSFPLCMQNLHQHFRKEHHMRHWGRMQYGLFLKGIGVSLEEAMRFWRSGFKLVDGDKFDKQYAYGIRHNYGKEGKRADYTPYSCMKIIMSNAPGPGDGHGCPFRHFDADLLRQRLQSLQVTKDGIEEIMGLVKGNHYQLACGRYFEFTHNMELNFSPNHPNQYFEESQKILNPDASSNITKTPRTPRSQNVSHNSQVSSQASMLTSKPSQHTAKDQFEDDMTEEMEQAMLMEAS